MRQWGTVLAAKNAPRLAEFLRERHIAEGLELGPPPLAWVKHLLETGQALVLLDGFDEVPTERREAVSLWIGRELEACSQAVFILSSRPGGYDDYVAERKPRTKLFVKPFTLDQIRDFASKWYVCQERLYRDRSAENREAVAAIAREKTQDLIGQIEKRKELRDLSSNPLLLNMLANYHRFYQGAELPKRRGDLYRDVFKMQLCDRPLAKGKEMDPPWPENQPILQGLALAMVQQNLTTISEAQLLEQLAPGLGEEAISPAGFLKQITEVSELLVERERQEYEFAHLSFQEYLAAAEIEKQGLEGELLKNYRESHWQGTLVLYAALTNPNRLLRGLLEKDTLEAAELAYKCLQETPRNVDEGLRGRCSKRSSRS